MPTCTIVRTHLYGEQLDRGDWPRPILGPIQYEGAIHPNLNRRVSRLRVMKGNGSSEDAIPALYEPQLLTLMSNQGMMFGGFEEIDGKRYYQSWYIRWVD